MKRLVVYNRVIFVLAIAGFLVAGYVLKGYLEKSPLYCPAGGGCEIVQKSPYAWPLGIPVPAFGFVGYTVMLVLSFLRTVRPEDDWKLLLGILGVAIFGVLFVTGFSLTEAFLIKGFCFWCIVSTVIMCLIFGLAVASVLGGDSLTNVERK